MIAPMPPELIKAYSYIRFSTPQQALGDSLRRQTEKAAKYAAGHGLTLDTELNLSDLGVSAYRQSNAKKGALRVFLDEVEAGRIAVGSYLLIENMDRLSRDEIFEALGPFLTLINSGITVVTLTDERLYSRETLRHEGASAMHYIIAELTRAHAESRRKSQLVGAAKARKKQQLLEHGIQGKPYTRQTPAWLNWSDDSKAYEVLPDRAAIVREIFERTDAGDGIDRIAKDLNQRGVDTWGGGLGKRKANHWRGGYMRKILTSSAPIGSFTPHTTDHDELTGARRDTPMEPILNMFPAVVGEELYWRVHRRFATTAARGKNARHDPKSIVAGITRCATCGNVVTRVSKGTYVYLVCSRANMRAQGCKYLAVPYGDVEAALRENVGWLIEEAPRGKNTAELDREIAGLVTMELHYSGEASDLADLAAREKSLAARRRLREKEAELRETQARLRTITTQRDTMTTASVRDRLNAVTKALGADTVDVVAANQALRQAMSRIVLDPEKARLEVYWHHSPESVQVIYFHTRHKVWAEGPYDLSDHGTPTDTKAS
jgi:DNA invertase Pin-like site-specific DNA recombinase